MNIASTIQQAREAKSENAVKVNAASNASNNGANTNANSNAAVAQTKEVVKTDSVEVSQKSVALASAAKADTASKVVVTPQETTTTTISDPKVEKANKKVTAAEKSQDKRADASKAMRKNQQELRSLVAGLKKLGMGSREVSKIVRAANRKANKVVGAEIKQAYNDFRSHQINKQSFYNKLYGAAVKKLDGLVSALRNAYDQKIASSQNQTVTVKPIETLEPVRVKTSKVDKAAAKAVKDAQKLAAKAEKMTEKEVAKAEKAEKTEKTTPPGLAKKTENGNTIKAEKEGPGGPVAGNGKSKGLLFGNGNGNGNGNGIFGPGGLGNAEKGFGQIVDFFNDIDKMINGFAGIAEGKGNDKDDSLLNFASRLSDMFSGINKAFGRHENDNVGHKLGMAQVKKETVGQLFNSGHGSGSINRIGDAGEGTGNFNAVSFMSSLSNSINDGLDAYKDIQKAEKESKEESTKEEAVTTVA